MKKSQKGFSVGVVLLILVVIGLVGFVGWLVWQNQKPQSVKKDATGATTSNTQQAIEPLSLIETNVPVGWTVEIKESERVFLNNASTMCYTSVRYSTDMPESSSPDIDQNKQTVDAIKSKGYSVEETKGKLTIVASNGEKQLDAQLLKVTGFGNSMFQNYAYITKSDSYTEIQLSCPNKADLQTAQTALMAIIHNQQ